MSSEAMANFIIGKMKSEFANGSGNEEPTAKRANEVFYDALCEYVENNAIVLYAWAGTNALGASDPVTVISAKIKTTGSLSPNYLENPESALSQFNLDLNTQAKLWQVEWPEGFELLSAFELPEIEITLSKATSMEDAWRSVCSEIVDGITGTKATASVTGIHGAYSGTATITSIT